MPGTVNCTCVVRRGACYALPAQPIPRVEVTMEELKIIGVVAEEVTEPRNDGSASSALYAVPVRLSRSADRTERELLERHWDRPPSWTTMHRPGILRVSGDRLILDGTTIDEVERYHAKTLSLVVDQTNRDASNLRARAQAQATQAALASDEHRANVSEVADRIKF